MRIGGSDFKDSPTVFDEERAIVDSLNLPPAARPVSLWESLHDAQVVSIRSNLLDRTMVVSCEIEHLREFYKLDDRFRFILRLKGVQSARVIRYTIWPGGCSIPDGLSIEDQQRIVEEYQAKWREESGSWTDFESGITRENEQVFDISHAAITASSDGPVALKIDGRLNYVTYHEVYLRFEKLRITGSDGRQFGLEEFLRMGEAYWIARSRRAT